MGAYPFGAGWSQQLSFTLVVLSNVCNRGAHRSSCVLELDAADGTFGDRPPTGIAWVVVWPFGSVVVLWGRRGGRKDEKKESVKWTVAKEAREKERGK